MSEPLSEIPASPPSARREILRQAIIVWVVTMVIIRVFHELQRIPFFKENIMLFTGLTLIYVPVFVLWRRGERIKFFESTWGELGRSIGWFLLISAIIFPVVELCNRYFQPYFMHARYVGGNWKGMANTGFYHVLLVALPEEFFFRGYLQTKLDQVWPTNFKFLGAKVGKGLWVASFIFALSHSLIQQRWWHFAIFFPAVGFGWFREKTGAITAGILFHALCNLYSYWVAINYRAF